MGGTPDLIHVYVIWQLADSPVLTTKLQYTNTPEQVAQLDQWTGHDFLTQAVDVEFADDPEARKTAGHYYSLFAVLIGNVRFLC